MNMSDKGAHTCCFTGHRDIGRNTISKIQRVLESTIIELITQKGVIYFGNGGALGFDTIAAQKVIELRNVYPIKLIMVLPCRGQEAKWPEKDKAVYREIIALADKVVYLAETYYEGCMPARNRHLVNHSQYCVCYKTREEGGTAYTVRYAQERKRVIINLAELF